ncbi:hypothetical protein N7452_003647 [Penicillium brevicompactum]|uniref:Uncharacterized protein n=1 Tax=Penicillium brevicompactum TaxID=5074 RepID=A0A9W9QWC4_PENBR|nr:hypothetical protein N7452_003647 [Penicillium brevicompactum]
MRSTNGSLYEGLQPPQVALEVTTELLQLRHLPTAGGGGSRLRKQVEKTLNLKEAVDNTLLSTDYLSSCAPFGELVEGRDREWPLPRFVVASIQ